MLCDPRLKLDEAELRLTPPPLLNALLLRELGERDTCRLPETRSPPLGLVDGRVVGRFAEERSPPGRLADVRSPPGRLADVRSPPGRLVEARSPPGRLVDARSPPGRLVDGRVDGRLVSPRTLPPYLFAVALFE